jgi:hypothetical protein
MASCSTFADYLEWRAASGGGHAGDLTVGSGDVSCDPMAERSVFRGLFKVVNVVNPARPASPLNSLLRASPAKKKRPGSQVVGH